MAGMLGRDELERRLGYHRAIPATVEVHKRVREAVLGLAVELDEILPAGREAACAQTALQEAAMWANAAVAIHQAPLALGE